MSLTPDDEVRSREELAAFVRRLHQDFLQQGDAWENNTLATFLEALGRVLKVGSASRPASS
ncbi:DUF7660 family protein [Streptomyces rochei]|uniref:DUF7660 family protein n=1 Tax=Streptomyces rochei TaxID=1928 RepID=UPI0036F7BB87